MAVLLAGEVLDSREARASFDRSVESLLSERIPADDGPDRPLWTGVYDLQGQPNRRLPEFSKDVDLLACRNVMQVLLTAYLVTLNPKADEATRDAVKAIGALPPENAPAGRWHRFYDRRGHPTIPPRPTSGPAEGQARRRGMFARPDEAPEPTEDTVDLGPLLALARHAAERGGPEIAKELAGQVPFNRRLAEVACGLSDDPLAGQLPAGKGAADARQCAAAASTAGPRPRAAGPSRRIVASPATSRGRVPSRINAPGSMNCIRPTIGHRHPDAALPRGISGREWPRGSVV